MRASELPAIGLRARPIQLSERHRLWGRTIGASPLSALEPDRRGRDATAPLSGAWRLGAGD